MNEIVGIRIFFGFGNCYMDFQTTPLEAKHVIDMFASGGLPKVFRIGVGNAIQAIRSDTITGIHTLFTAPQNNNPQIVGSGFSKN